MSRKTAEPRSSRSAAAAVAAVAVLQVVATIVAALLWYFSTVFAGGSCSPDCDWAAADRAGMALLLAIVVSYLVSASAFIVAWRTSRNLAWVPLVAIAIIATGYLVASWMFQRAMS